MTALTTPNLSLTLEPVTVPASVQSADAASFRDMVTVRNASATRSFFGTDDDAITAADLLPVYQPTAYSERRAWLVRSSNAAVARFVVDLPAAEDRHVAMVQLDVHPDHRRKGFGRFAADAAEGIVKDLGRTEIRTWVAHTETGGPRIAAPTGAGSVSADDPAARMLTRRGYQLGQVERFSALTLDSDSEVTLTQARASGQVAAGDAYRFVSWQFPTPGQFIDRYAALKARMSTDAPQGELAEDPQKWDPARVRGAVEAAARDAGRVVLVGAIEHVPTGALVAYNELFGPPSGIGTTDQEDTLVLREHRGHRLGLLVKAANLLEWRRVQPRSTRVTTYNAEENAAMIRVNDQLGFEIVVREGAWRKTLT
jgi:GNAT superfamily N-acetyltransferase